MWIQLKVNGKPIGDLVADTYIIKPYDIVDGSRYIFYNENCQVAYLEGLLVGTGIDNSDFQFELEA